MNSRTCSGWIRRISRGHMNSWRKCTPSSERQTPNWRNTSTSWSHSVSVSKTSFTILMMWSVYDKDHTSELRIKNRSERDLRSCRRTIVRSRAIFIPEWLENLVYEINSGPKRNNYSDHSSYSGIGPKEGALKQQSDLNPRLAWLVCHLLNNWTRDFKTTELILLMFIKKGSENPVTIN